jgi:hypothetical protein
LYEALLRIIHWWKVVHPNAVACHVFHLLMGLAEIGVPQKYE